ncbi:hypothetical protein DSM3645_10222 [Blastopirellula marina DSM 3645]|uniref:Uncharacterized protein n=1 Tax=Blastopirellula marina DSM 3645 TaxID=314230 RepID=A3ZLY5_9BACT|nr:hypothetical protein DSM3645_10222 [Blastopirellula marina DSM 3645]
MEKVVLYKTYVIAAIAAKAIAICLIRFDECFLDPARDMVSPSQMFQ